MSARDPLRAPIDHVLEEMADAVLVRCFEPRPHARPQRNVDAVKRRKRGNDDAKPVGEFGALARRRGRHCAMGSQYSSSSSLDAAIPPSIRPSWTYDSSILM